MTPDQIKKTYAKALAAQQAGRLADAEKGYARILKANPNIAEAQFNMGRIAAARKQIAAAAGHFEAALRVKPGEPAIWLAYFDIASRHPRPDNLAKLLSRAGEGVTRFPEAGFYHGLVASRRGQSRDAVRLIGQALKAGLTSSASVRAQVELGIAQAALGDNDAALASFDAALALSPEDDFAWARKSGLLRDLGRPQEALSAARRAIKSAPKQGAHYYAYASVAKLKADDPMIAQMQAAFKAAPRGDLGGVYLGHALAKAMEDTGQHDRMFAPLERANALLAKAYPFDPAADVASIEAYRTCWQRLVQSAPPQGDTPRGPVPIFVTGMPRSGTTLIEQILASHSDCEGAGELSVLGGMIGAVLEDAPRDPAELSHALRAVGQRYLDTLSARFPGAGYVTDKSISSYALIGFIRHALPQAKIIVVRRDPGDNALSLFKNLFSLGTHRYAARLPDIARFMRLFESQVAFWHAQQPGAFFEQRYEDLIANPEPASRALVVAAGLDWQEACLSFYDTARKVSTLSSTQVRQPIYSSSVGAAQRFKAQMTPFWDSYTPQ